MAFDAIETPFGKTDKIIGGAATYISMAASYFTPVDVVSVVGYDFPEPMIKMLQNMGVNTEGVEVRSDEKSFFWSGKYHNDLNTRDTLVTELNVLESFNPTLEGEQKKPDYLMLGNLTPDVQRSVIEQLDHKPKLIGMDTMNFWMDIAMESLKQTVSMVNVLIINDEEARQFTGEYSLVKAARQILGMGPRYLIIKKGEHGALLFSKEQIFYAPALPIEEVFDPTGAGDTFAGGFMGYIAQQDSTSFETLKKAVLYGSAMASFCVEKFGTEQLQQLGQPAINERVQSFLKLTEVEQVSV